MHCCVWLRKVLVQIEHAARIRNPGYLRLVGTTKFMTDCPGVDPVAKKVPKIPFNFREC